MKFIVLGTSEFILYCSRGLIESGATICALISLPKKVLPLNSAGICDFAREKEIPYYEIEEINSAESFGIIKSYSPDYIFSSWPKIIGKKILKIPKRYAIGTHPTALPLHRGRHPLHWLIALGITESKLSFFVLDEGIDKGWILLQVPFRIEAKDKIANVVSKMNLAAYNGTKKLCRKLSKTPAYRGVKQNHRAANYWRKRTPHDVILDPRMSKDMILRTVRSFAFPYPCARLVFEKHVLKIWDASIAESGFSSDEIQSMEQGKILRIKKDRIKLKADDGIVELRCKDSVPTSLLQAKYIHPSTYYIAKWPGKIGDLLK